MLRPASRFARGHGRFSRDARSLHAGRLDGAATGALHGVAAASTSPSGFARCGAEAFGSPLVGAQPANPVELATMRVPSDWPTTAPRAAISGRISGRTGRALSRARASSSRPITMPAPGLWHRECLPAARRWVLRAVRSRAHVRPTSQPAARHPVRRLPCRCAGRDVPHPLQCQTRHPAIRTTVAAFR